MIIKGRLSHLLSPLFRKYDGKKWEYNTLLHVAAKEGYARMVEFQVNPASHSVYELTQVDIDPLNVKKRTPLHLAFTPPQVSILHKLIPDLPSSFHPVIVGNIEVE